MNLTTFGMMRRACAVEIGQDRAMEAVKQHKAKLLLLPSDAPERALRNARTAPEGESGVTLLSLPWTNEELSSALGVGSCNMLAVTDSGFAQSIRKDLGGD